MFLYYQSAGGYFYKKKDIKIGRISSLDYYINQNAGNQKILRIILLGGPGCGKGTQSNKIKVIFNLLHISTGDLLREEVKSRSKLGKKLKKIMDEGKLVSDKMVLDLVKQKIKNHNGGFILDGFPRNIKQSIKLEKMLKKMNKPITHVININVPEKILIKRIVKRGKTSGRSDDNKTTVKKRISTYYKTASPIINYYENQNILHEIDGNKSVRTILKKIKKILMN